jgi:protein gp37
MAWSKIEWTEASWNPLTGCSKISPGCKNCYAERMANRLKAMGNPNYRNGFKLTLHEHALAIPLAWKSPRIIFVNSMSDLFHEDVPIEFIRKVFATMSMAKQHVFQVLTKRSSRLASLAGELKWPRNVWMGVSVESSDYKYRIDNLRRVPASIRFLSMEPLIAPIGEVDLSEIDWVIVGGESGPNARPMREEWVTEIRDQTLKANAAFFFKQWGGVHKKKAGRVLEGLTWDQMPAAHKQNQQVAQM